MYLHGLKDSTITLTRHYEQAVEKGNIFAVGIRFSMSLPAMHKTSNSSSLDPPLNSSSTDYVAFGFLVGAVQVDDDNRQKL